MAPELFQDDGVYSFASDFWSLGCLLFEMASGKPPFYTSSLKALIQMITTDPVPQIPELSFELNDIIQKLLLKDPLQRPTWSEIRAHPVWLSSSPAYEFKTKNALYPVQPQFSDFIQQTRGISDLDFFYSQRNKPDHQFGAINQKIDFMRISMNV
jgi:serine/threonine-protein kinase ULK4